MAKFDGVIIETTGLANPAPMCQTFFVDDDVKQMYQLDSVITVADAKYIVEWLDEKKPEGWRTRSSNRYGVILRARQAARFSPVLLEDGEFPIVGGRSLLIAKYGIIG